ncbi:MAG: thiamine-phosphate kinase [Thermoplasmata archaeon]
MSEKENPSLSELGEREIVKRLISAFPSRSYVPPGDDCGAIEFEDRLILFTTDTKVSDTHFPERFSSFDKGWSIAAANLSDIAAMGGIPIAFLVAYGLPREMPFADLEQIQAGIDACLSKYSVPLVGADTKEHRVLTITGTAIGTVDKKEVLLRKGSKPGDVVCVTGALGGAALGLKSMRENLGIGPAEDRLRRPEPRIKEGRILAKSGVVTSCIDISDGLSSELYELMRASGNGFEIDVEKIPLHESLRGYDADEDEKTDIALHSGDEYELVFTASQEGLDDLRTVYESHVGKEFAVIGKVVERKEIVQTRRGRTELLLDRGYEHFR